MKKEIKSTEFYKNHNASYFCSATIKNGKITSLYSEYGREGGIIWEPGHEYNGNLQKCLTGLLEDFGRKFYNAVLKMANREEGLLSLAQAKREIRSRDIAIAAAEVKRTKKAYDKALGKLNDLKNTV